MKQKRIVYTEADLARGEEAVDHNLKEVSFVEDTVKKPAEEPTPETEE